MRCALFTSILGATAAYAQLNETVLTNLDQALSQAGLTSLASLAASIVNTTEGASLLTSITNTTSNVTILAPSNDALGKLSSSESKNASEVATLLSYHVVQGGFLKPTDFFVSPNHTILRTFLNNTSVVQLEGNFNQVIAATVEKGTITLLNQSPVINVTKATNFSNFDILTIDGVLTIPPSIDTVLKNAGLTNAAQALQAANLSDAISQAHGVTIFAPTDAAFQKALSALGSQATNETLIEIVIQNHIINGTSVYSSDFSNSYTSAGGESVHFNVTGNTTWVLSGDGNDINATVTTKDLIASNGVVHIIDAVLANNQSNPDAASSAFSSATSAAASSSSQSPTASGPVGATPSTSSDNSAPLATRAAPVLVALLAVALSVSLL